MRTRSHVLASLSLLGGLFSSCSAATDGSDGLAQGQELTSGKREAIVGGDDAGRGDWPWQVAILKEDSSAETGKSFHCGGVILSDTWVLTAAHCVWRLLVQGPIDPYTFVAGEHRLDRRSGDEQERVAAEIIVHPHYGTAFRGPDRSPIGGDAHNDVALVRLSVPLELNDRVQTIPLSGDILPAGTDVWATGWGRTVSENPVPPNKLQEVKNEVVDLAECKAVLREVVERDTPEGAPPKLQSVSDSTICMGSLAPDPEGACRGDSGGPLVAEDDDGNWELVGITSWGDTGTCGSYSAFSSARAFKHWVETTMKASSGPSSCSGRTVPGNTGWKTYSSGGVGTPVRTEACNYDNETFGMSTPAMYFTSLGGVGSLGSLRGASSIYHSSETGFQANLNQSGLTSEFAEENRFHINWEVVPSQVNVGTLCTGITGNGSWEQVARDSIALDVDISRCGFAETPVILTTLVGRSNHWSVAGVNSVYKPTPDGFQIRLQRPGIRPTHARNGNWRIGWQASPVGTDDAGGCWGRTTPGDTGWKQGSNGLKVDVDTSDCGEDYSPIYLSSVAGESSLVSLTGTNSIYRPKKDGFRIEITTSRSPVFAETRDWHVNWKAVRD